MNVLVVGGAGYVGGATTDLLSEQGYRVRVFDCLMYEEDYRKPVDFICADVRNWSELKPQLDWADAVVWLAAVVGDGACALNPEAAVETNQETVRMLVENYHGRIVYVSTCSVYGARDGVLDEQSPTQPLSVYAATKLAAENYLRQSNAIIFRLGTLFGVGDLFSRIRLDLVVNALTVHAYCKGRVNIFGGDQFRPLLHVRDAAQAIVDSLETEHRGIFNLSKQNVRIIDLAHQIRNHFPDLVIEQTEQSFEDSRNYRVSAKKARQVLGFRPRWTIDDGIEQIKSLLQSGRIKDVDNPRYRNHSFLKTLGAESLRVAGRVLPHTAGSEKQRPYQVAAKSRAA